MKQNRKSQNRPIQIFDKGAKAIQWGKDSLFNRWRWNNLIPMCKIKNLDTDLTSSPKFSSKWIIDLTVIHKIIKFLEHKRKPRWPWAWQWLLKYNQWHDSWKKLLISWTSFKLKTSVACPVKRISRQATAWEKTLVKDIPDKVLLSKYTKNS